MERLLSIREGQRRVIQQYLQRIEAAKQDPTPAAFNTILQNIRQKLESVKEIDQKIIEVIQPSEIETEILDAEEYTLNIDIEISSLEHFRRSQGFNPDRELYQPNNEPILQMMPGIQTSQQTVSSNFSQSHKLPKLSLPTFSGDLLQWQTFWDSYESSIHNNPSLTEVQKFTYLKAQIEGTAANTIAGFALTNANYSRAVDLLHERYGQTHKIVQAYMQALLQLPAPSNTLNSLQRYYDQLESYIRGLESLGQPQETYGSLLVPVVIGKLPVEIRKNLAREHGSDSWILADLRKAIHKEITIMDVGQTTVIPEVHDPTALFFTGSRQKSKTPNYKKTDTFRNNERKTCAFCDEQHSSNNCDKINTRESRIEIVKKKHLCFNCLGNHQVSKCRSNYRCRHCKRKHHTSICESSSPESTGSTEQTDQRDTAMLHSAIQSKPNLLLKTAIAHVCSNQASAEANILFDEGAQRSFITEELADRLKLTRGDTEIIHLTSFGDSNQSVRHMNTATVHLVTNAGNKIAIQVLIVPTIAVPLQNLQSSVTNLPYLRGLNLAHPLTHQTSFEISLLIGADYFWKIVQNRIVRGNGPTAVSSKIGYLLSGPLPMATVTPTPNHILNVVTSPPDVNQLEKFWKLESMGIVSDEEDSSSTEYLQQYQDKYITFKDGRYSVMLPWKPDHPALPTNYNITKRRTQNTIQRLRQEPEILKKYGEIIDEQERRGLIEKVLQTEIPSHNVHYIPHHGVKRESTTTPIRIVYDCSCRQSRDLPSLNDCLESTPPVLNDLTSILVRFRLHKYAVSTDIEKAFLHVRLDEKDRDFTRFLWLSNPDDASSPLATYRFKAVLFGATCSPFILSATILKHLQENRNNWVSEILKRDLYVDNILTSFPLESDILAFFRCTRNMMSDAGFNLRSWTSNSQVLISLAATENVCDTDKITKVLGMLWNTETDELSFPDRSIPISAYTTKREILQQTSRIYDPLGLLSPVTIRAKIMLQELWQHKYTWDTPLPDDIQQRWSILARDLNLIMKTKVPRHYLPSTCVADDSCDSADMNTLHIFVDASMQSYGAVAYLYGKQKSTFVMAKNRVAPLKTLTLPRLELMAAVMGSRLASHLQHACSIDVGKTYIWTDSQIVLHWLQTSKPLKRFVENRVREIREQTDMRNWRYCPTRDNPADLLTRGISAKQYSSSNCWTSGPPWIANPSKWPTWNVHDTSVLTTVTDETSEHSPGNLSSQPVSETTTTSGLHNIININKFSKYRKLLRGTAYVLRFVSGCRASCNMTSSLTVAELQKAEKLWLQSCQGSTYSNEISNLRSNRNRLPLVKQLRLFLDDEGFVRCGGRIHNAPLCEMTKFPYLLPSNHQLTHLVILDVHERQLHAGVSVMITYLRQKYWIPSIRQKVRNILRKCVICRKTEGKPYSAPDPPPLPRYRVDDAPPLSVTGVDFTGALYVRDNTGIETKAYICLFTCASTRAVHLEVVPDLTEESFLQAFRRFCSRMSVPKIMISHNASTYMAASNQIKRLFESDSLQETFGHKGTQWQFIPKRAPWYGGWWERLIGLTKTTLKKVLGRTYISYETLQTIVTEVEAVMNDRPLTYVTSDSTDPEPLTPAHLLYGRRLTILPYQDVVDTQITSPHLSDISGIRKRARVQKNLIVSFRGKWRREYLTALREHHQTTGDNHQTIAVGDVVQVHDEKSRSQWKLAVVEDLIEGKDGLIRAAKIKTNNGVTNRAIIKLYPLEVISK